MFAALQVERLIIEEKAENIDRTRIYSEKYDKEGLDKFLIRSLGKYKTEKLTEKLKNMEVIIAYGKHTEEFGDRIYTEELKFEIIWDGILEAFSSNDEEKLMKVVKLFDDNLDGVEAVFAEAVRKAYLITEEIPVDFVIKMENDEIREFIKYDYEEYLKAKADYEKKQDEDVYVKKMYAYDMAVDALKELLRRKRITRYRFKVLRDEIYAGAL